MHPSLDADLRLVGVDEHPGSQQVQHLIHSDSVNLSQASLGTLPDSVHCKQYPNISFMLRCNVSERLPKGNMLVDRPAFQGMPGLSGPWGTSQSRRSFRTAGIDFFETQYLMTHRLTPVRVNFRS